MGTSICYHDGWFFEWSTTSDMPESAAMTREEFEAYYREEFGRNGMEGLPRRLERALKNGTSAHGQTLESLIMINNCGVDDEHPASLEEIMKLVISYRDEEGEETSEPV